MIPTLRRSTRPRTTPRAPPPCVGLGVVSTLRLSRLFGRPPNERFVWGGRGRALRLYASNENSRNETVDMNKPT
eukprot:1176412-Prorocentrum_minimum.AAC.1